MPSLALIQPEEKDPPEIYFAESKTQKITETFLSVYPIKIAIDNVREHTHIIPVLYTSCLIDNCHRLF